MVEETVTISTQMFVRILAMVSMAEESNVLPEGCEWLQRRVCDTLLLQNGWRNSQCDDLMNMVKAELEFLKEHKFVEEGLITEEQTRGFLKGNVLKYLVRYEDKGGMDDLIKAHEYLTRLIAFEDGGDNND